MAVSPLVSRDSKRRLTRSIVLAERYPYAAEAVRFYARLIPFTAGLDELKELVVSHGPAALRESAAGNGELWERFASELLGHHQCRMVLVSGAEQFVSYCGVCDGSRTVPRAACPACGARQVVFYGSESLPHLQAQVCEVCKRYVHIVHMDRDPEAIADLDELAAMPLDLFLRELGFVKVRPNLIGL